METVELEQRYSERRGLLELWAGILVAPVAWALHLNGAYLLVRIACDTGSTMLIHLCTLGALLLGATGGWIAWRSFDRLGREWPSGSGEGIVVRSRFMAVGGLISSGISLLAILAQAIPPLILSPCQ